MGRTRSWWAWLSNPDNRATLALLGGAVVTVIGAGWALYLHFYKPPLEIKPAVTGVQIGGSVTAGRDVVIQNIQLTPDQYAAFLEQRQKEKAAKIPQAGPEQRALLEKELAKIKTDKENLQRALEEEKVRLAEATKSLDDFKRDFPPEQLDKAKKNLAKGETGAAEALFRQALDKSTEQAAEAAYQLGALAESRIDYRKAGEYYQRAVQLQPDNPVYLNAAGNLSSTLGQYKESERLLKRALELREKSLKPDDPDVAASLNNLAVLYANQGKYTEAEPLYKRSLAIQEKALGPEHQDVAVCLNNLAALYFRQGKYAEAEPLYKRALAIREKVLGPEHPLVGTCLNNLALLYGDQEKYAEAEPLFKRALVIHDKALSPEHPKLAEVLKNYAALLKKMGREGEAAPLEARARAIRAKHAEKNLQR